MTLLENIKDNIRWSIDFLQHTPRIIIVDHKTYVQLLREQHRDVGPADKLQILGIDVIRSFDVKGFKIY